jgi:hypothetical protein
MIGCVLARVSSDDDSVARLEGHRRHALVIELTHCFPLDGPALHLPIRVGRHDLQQRVRIAIDELHQLALDGQLFVFHVGGAKRVMRKGPPAAEHCGRQHDANRGSLHHDPLILARLARRGA